MVATALAGCSQGDGIAPELQGDDVIRLSSTMLTAGASTRAPFVGTIGATNQLTALVPSATVSASYETDLHAAGPMIFDGQTYTGYDAQSVTTTEARFPNTFTGTEQLYLFGLYPYNKTTPVWAIDTGGATATATFNGSQDLMAAAQISITKDGVKDAIGGKGTFEVLEFSHLLTKLEVNFKASAAAVADFGSIKSVELVSDATASAATLPTEVTYDPVTAAVDFTNGTNKVATLPFYSAITGTYTDTPYIGQLYRPTPTAELQAYCMAAPVMASPSPGKYEYYIRITTNGDAAPAATKIIPIDLNDAGGAKFAQNTAGYAFNIIVNYSVDDILVTATVADWKVGGDTTVSGM